MGAPCVVLAPVLVNLHLGHVGNLQFAGVTASCVVHINHEVGHFSGEEEVLAQHDRHAASLAADEADLLFQRHSNIELWVIDDGTQW